MKNLSVPHLIFGSHDMYIFFFFFRGFVLCIWKFGSEQYFSQLNKAKENPPLWFVERVQFLSLFGPEWTWNRWNSAKANVWKAAMQYLHRLFLATVSFDGLDSYPWEPCPDTDILWSWNNTRFFPLCEHHLPALTAMPCMSFSVKISLTTLCNYLWCKVLFPFHSGHPRASHTADQRVAAKDLIVRTVFKGFLLTFILSSRWMCSECSIWKRTLSYVSCMTSVLCLLNARLRVPKWKLTQKNCVLWWKICVFVTFPDQDFGQELQSKIKNFQRFLNCSFFFLSLLKQKKKKKKNLHLNENSQMCDTQALSFIPTPRLGICPTIPTSRASKGISLTEDLSGPNRKKYSTNWKHDVLAHLAAYYAQWAMKSFYRLVCVLQLTTCPFGLDSPSTLDSELKKKRARKAKRAVF